MTRNRMEAFSDGVLAIIITIMVLEIKAPESFYWDGIKEILPIFISYILSYVYVGIYWMNHHHLVNAVEMVDGKILWANMNWLFWMSLIPFATSWMGSNLLTKAPTLLYGIILLMSAISYNILQRLIVKRSGKDSELAKSIGKDRKGTISLSIYVVAVLFALWMPIISYVLYFIGALLWIIPDVRIEDALKK